MSSLSPLQTLSLSSVRIDQLKSVPWQSAGPETYVRWVTTESHVEQTITLKLVTKDRKSTTGSNTQNATSSITLPESAFHSRDALLSFRDSFLAWIVRERLSRPDFEQLWPHLQIPTYVGWIPLAVLVNSSTNVE